MDNREILKKFEEQYKYTLVIDMYEVVLFRRVEFDDPEDYYYDLVKFNGEKYLSSCVGRIIPLKGIIKPEEYECLVSVWNYNNSIKID